MTIKVLTVDDSNFMRNIIKKALEKEEFKIVAEASSGEKAIELYQELDPDIVTMDLTMPGIGGLKALKKLKEFDPDVRVIICSAMSQEPLVIEAMRSGAKEFIVKPFSEDRIIRAARNVMK